MPAASTWAQTGPKAKAPSHSRVPWASKAFFDELATLGEDDCRRLLTAQSRRKGLIWQGVPGEEEKQRPDFRREDAQERLHHTHKSDELSEDRA